MHSHINYIHHSRALWNFYLSTYNYATSGQSSKKTTNVRDPNFYMKISDFYIPLNNSIAIKLCFIFSKNISRIFINGSYFWSHPKMMDFSKKRSGILDPRIPTFWNSASGIWALGHGLTGAKIHFMIRPRWDPPQIGWKSTRPPFRLIKILSNIVFETRPNEAISKIIQVCGAEISSKTCVK
jgi:hypothetical protein